MVPTNPSKPSALVQQPKSEEMPIIEDLNKNVADVTDLNKTKKVYSWASNYLQSIGHNNLKPIKINLSSSRNKESVNTSLPIIVPNEIQHVVPTCDSNENTKTFGNKEKDNPDNKYYKFNANKKLDVKVQKRLGFFQAEQILPANPQCCMVDTIYSNGNNTIAPAYATLLTTAVGESTYYYNTEGRGIDIFGAIKSKINSEFSIERKTRMMNLPNHKEMCENFIKEISKTKTPEKRKAQESISRASSTTKRSKSEHSETPLPRKKKIKTTKPVKEIKNLVKKDNKPKTKKSDITATPDNKNKPNIKKSIIEHKDLDIILKNQIVNTKVKRESPENNILKRIHKVSEEFHNSRSNLNTSIKSVVQVSENHPTNSPRKQCLDENFDLRSKLSRVNERIKKRNYYLQRLKEADPINKRPMDNLKITVDNSIPEKQKSPKNLGVLKYKSKKCKKLKLIINVVCKESDDDSSSNDSSFSETENNPTPNMDLSFLDDFNVDEIVDSLKHSPIKKTVHEDSTKNKMEPELKLSKILNILNAKSETNKTKNLKTESKMEEIISATLMDPSTHAEINGVSKEKKKQRPQTPTQNTHALTKLLTQSTLHFDQENTHEESCDSLITKELNTINTNENRNEEVSESNNTLIIDKNVVNKYQEIQNVLGIKIPFDENVLVNDKVNDENYTKVNKIYSAINSLQRSEDSIKVDKCMTLNSIKKEVCEGKKELNNTEESVTKTKDDISIIDLANDVGTNDVVARSEPNKPARNHGSNTRISKIVWEPNKIKTTPKIEIVDLTSAEDAMMSNIADTKSDEKTDSQTEILNKILIKQEYLRSIPLPETIYKTANDKTLIKFTDKNNATTTANNEPYDSIKNTIMKQCNEVETVGIKKSYAQEETRNMMYGQQVELPLLHLPYSLACKTLIDALVVEQNQEQLNIKEIIDNQKTNESLELDIMGNHNKENVSEEHYGKSVKGLSIEKESETKWQCKENAQENQNTNKMFETETVKKVTNNIVEVVWENNKTLTDGVFELNNNDRTGTEVNLYANKDIIKQTLSTKINKLTTSNNQPLIKTIATDKKPFIKIKPLSNQEPSIKTTQTSKEPLTKTTPTFNEPLIKITPTLNEPFIKTRPTSKAPLIEITPTSKETLIKTRPNSNESLIKTTQTSNEPLINITSTSNAPLTNKEPSKTPPTINIKKFDKNVLNKTQVPLLEKKMEENLHIKMKVIKCMHRGRFSTIFSCKDPSGQTYTAKLIKNKDPQNQEEMLTRLQQDIPQQNLNTVFLLDGFLVQTRWCFIMDYYPKTLKEALDAQVNNKPFDINLVQDLARQLISAVMLLRNNLIIHSDINPSHILLNVNHDRLKLCGFDRAYYIHEANPIPSISTPNYRAPEIILGFSASYSVDVWASALVIYEMAANKLLFKGIFNNEILYQQMSTFGNLPWDMVDTSQFQKQHFRGRLFMKRYGFRGRDIVLIDKFYKTKRMHTSLIAANKEHWFKKDYLQWNSDMFKLSALTNLLEQMLVLDPRKRLDVEFVLLDPFIFDVL